MKSVAAIVVGFRPLWKIEKDLVHHVLNLSFPALSNGVTLLKTAKRILESGTGSRKAIVISFDFQAQSYWHCKSDCCQ